MKSIKGKFFILISVFALFFTALAMSATPVFSVTEELKNEALGQIQQAAGDPTGVYHQDPRLWIGKVIQVFISLLGAIFLILLGEAINSFKTTNNFSAFVKS